MNDEDESLISLSFIPIMKYLRKRYLPPFLILQAFQIVDHNKLFHVYPPIKSDKGQNNPLPDYGHTIINKTL
jgi:hypothetical protein